MAWLLAGRFRHIAKACADRPAADTLVHERLALLMRWGRVRTAVTVLLYLGIAGSLATFLGSRIPGLADAAYLLEDAAALTGTFTGVLTLAFLFLTRLLGQIEADILMLLAIKD